MHYANDNDLPAVPPRPESRLLLALMIAQSIGLWFAQGLWVWRFFGL